MLTPFAILAATFGYLGYSPVAPGTVGSAAGLVLYALLRLTASSTVEVVTIVLLFAVGVWSGGVAEPSRSRTS